MATGALIVALLAGVARADGGFYLSEGVGVAHARGDLAAAVGRAIHTRLAIGARWRWLAIEPWIGTALQTDRDGAFRGLVGGEPAPGRADLEHYGLDLKLIAPVHATPGAERLEAYARFGASLVGATGALDHYAGRATSVAVGVQLTGTVRALGFLWTPLFFLKRGPKITGALFLDQGWDFVRLRDGEQRLAARVAHVSVGFALGSAF